MNIESLIFNRIKSTSAFESVKSNVFEVYRDGVVPSIVYDVSSDGRDYDYSGSNPIYQVDITVITEKQANSKALAEVIRTAFDSVRWTDTGTTLVSFAEESTPDSIDRGSKQRRVETAELRFTVRVEV